MALIGSGCMPAEHAPRGPRALSPPTPSGFAEIWVNADLQPIGQPTAVGSAIVGLVMRDGFLFLIGIDPPTGHVRWAKRVTVPGWITRSQAVHVVAVGSDKVAYVRPIRTPGLIYHPQIEDQLVVVDANTGAELASSPPVLFYSWPYPCANGKDACTLSNGERARQQREHRLEIASDSFIDDSESLPDATRVLESHGLLDLADRPGNTLAWLRDGQLRWSLPVTLAFPPGFTSDAGWSWQWFADQRVVVGSVYEGYPSGDQTLRRDLALTTASVGLADTTGEVLWRDVGSDFGCLDDASHPPVRCRRRGIMTIPSEGANSFEGLDITVEGFDPATGKTTWAVPLGASTTLVGGNANRSVAGPAQIVVDEPSGPVVLDYGAGTASPPAPGTTFWCLTRKRYRLGSEQRDRPGGKLASICDRRGQPSTVLPSPESTIAAGASTGDHAVIATESGYLGFRLR